MSNTSSLAFDVTDKPVESPAYGMGGQGAIYTATRPRDAQHEARTQGAQQIAYAQGTQRAPDAQQSALGNDNGNGNGGGGGDGTQTRDADDNDDSTDREEAEARLIAAREYPMPPELINRLYMLMCRRMDREIDRRERDIAELHELLRQMDLTTLQGSSESVFYEADRQRVLAEVDVVQRELAGVVHSRDNRVRMFEDRVRPFVAKLLERLNTLKEVKARSAVFHRHAGLFEHLLGYGAEGIMRIDKICRILFSLPPPDDTTAPGTMPAFAHDPRTHRPLLSLSPPATAPTHSMHVHLPVRGRDPPSTAHNVGH